MSSRLIGSIAMSSVAVLVACGSDESASPGDLPADALTVVNSAPFAHGSWQWDAVELGSGKILYAKDENELNFLGSTTKLFTAGTYFDEFGADSTLETPVFAVGARNGATLQGDLVLVGAGDFILGSRGVLDGDLQYIDPDDHIYAYAIPTSQPVKADPLAGLDKLAKEVVAKGITSIEGDVLVNDKLWEPDETKEGVLTSIMVNDNPLDILVDPGAKAGDPITMTTRPQTGFYDVVNQAVTSAAGSEFTATATLGAGNRVVVSGNMPIGSKQLDLTVYAPDPAAYARALFIEALRRAGLAVNTPLDKTTGTLPSDSAYTDKVASLTSPPTSTLVKLVTKISHNRGAETLLCLLAKKAGSRDCDDGLTTIIGKFANADIEPGTVEIYDGEGSDPASATPAAMVRWLTWIQNQPWGAKLKEGLPDINHDGKILVKSGLSARPNVGAMHSMFVAAGQAGYMTTASGKEVVVAFYALNGTYATFEEGIDAFPATAKVLTAIQKAE
ncbi:D-alanyl-D-alanine carboxypeptidase/D-alanyl-D-alanine-endopeptidase [Antrihabitans stalactiti]|uniref:D-alanyl-D-alanine carboxypeptidase/D-alanyl-D-alanine-endopeptidase n=1 Tax=Antrihabitans stalactiti TaxID=2584121 RepID=A0A848K5P7_9NOCA|nr:D-alanyl-D-alanine carboxypeptidase/D-alanyl-D-alanine-endopeptidase [Antrihabitans stalactiti]NMN94395.1 D-alanyl-D-alanine carboxypeptidase/D-alanyl-D-alanine-endopeptidase [Antrihabitans stalactiti]